MPNLRKWQKPHFGPDFGSLDQVCSSPPPNLLVGFTLLDVRYSLIFLIKIHSKQD